MLVGILFIIITLLISPLVRPKGKYSPEKYIPYECGEIPVGSAWIQFNIRFYVIALIFIIFDVEVIFLLPWAVVFIIFLAREYGVQAWATDLGFPATDNLRRIGEAGLSDRVLPIHADTRCLPCGEAFFDATVCVDA